MLRSSVHPNVADLSALQSRLLWCYEGNVAAENRHKWTHERQLCVWWLQKGSATVRRETQVWQANKGEWLFTGPKPHHQDFSNDAEILSINFKLEWPSGDSLIEQPLVVQARDFPGLARKAKPLLRFIRRHYPGIRTDLWSCPADLVSFFELQRLFSAWMSTYLRVVLSSGITPVRVSGIDPRISTALRELDRLPWARPFQEKELARQIGLSVGHLDRLFVEQLDTTPRAYWQRRRYASAVARLGDSAMPIKKIGYDLGFSSPGHFSHWFRKTSGQSPREYRLMQQR